MHEISNLKWEVFENPEVHISRQNIGNNFMIPTYKNDVSCKYSQWWHRYLTSHNSQASCEWLDIKEEVQKETKEKINDNI